MPIAQNYLRLATWALDYFAFFVSIKMAETFHSPPREPHFLPSLLGNVAITLCIALLRDIEDIIFFFTMPTTVISKFKWEGIPRVFQLATLGAARFRLLSHLH